MAGVRRPLDSGRKDSQGRTVRVSGDATEGRADAPSPFPWDLSNVRPDDSPFEVGRRVRWVSSADWTDGWGVTLTHRLEQAGRVTEVSDRGFVIEFDEVLSESGAPTSFEPRRPRRVDVAWFAVDARMAAGDLGVLDEPATVEVVSAEWLTARNGGEGSVAAREFGAATESARRDAAVKIVALANCWDRGEFVQLVSSAVYDDALMSGFRGNYEGVHAVCSFAYEEAQRRPGAGCSRHSWYAMGHRLSMREAGHDPGHLPDCTCETDFEKGDE